MNNYFTLCQQKFINEESFRVLFHNWQLLELDKISQEVNLLLGPYPKPPVAYRQQENFGWYFKLREHSSKRNAFIRRKVGICVFYPQHLPIQFSTYVFVKRTISNKKIVINEGRMVDSKYIYDLLIFIVIATVIQGKKFFLLKVIPDVIIKIDN